MAGLRQPQLSVADVFKFWDTMWKHNDGCWYWTKCTRRGYGCVTYRGVNYSTHRLAYFLHFGVDPLENLVCHTCDHCACNNPKHLFLGTYADNYKDCESKGRAKKCRGIKHFDALLTDGAIRQISLLATQGKTHRELGNMFGVTHQNISCIVQRKNWKHIT